jgi:hypothetical protein
MNLLDDKPAHHPGDRPKQAVVWPEPRHTENKIQQLRGSSKPAVANITPTTEPSQPRVQPPTTPATVSHVRVITKPAVNGQKTVTVQFTHPHGDPYFAGANVYLRRAGTSQPVLVAGGAKSPLQFTVPAHTAPHSLHVTSFGNWGETDVLSSPSHPVRLV